MLICTGVNNKDGTVTPHKPLFMLSETLEVLIKKKHIVHCAPDEIAWKFIKRAVLMDLRCLEVKEDD